MEGGGGGQLEQNSIYGRRGFQEYRIKQQTWLVKGKKMKNKEIKQVVFIVLIQIWFGDVK